MRTTLFGLYTFVSETTVWRIVQRGEVGAEEENGLWVEKRCLGYRSQVRTDLQPKCDRRCGGVLPF